MMKLKAKIIILLLLVVLLLGTGGCGKEEASQSIDLAPTAQWLLEQAPKPSYGSVGGEWLVIGMVRSSTEVPEDYFEVYYEQLAETVKRQEGILDERKMTEYSRVILALTAIGKNPADVEGYNLLAPLANFEKTIFQGMNGPAFALLALDAGNYEIPVLEGEGVQAGRGMYVDYLLEHEIEGGGWSLAGGEAEADITAMVLQALAKYQDREEVAAAVNRGINVLSVLQQENGGYMAYDTESSETIAQVILALTELGIDVQDERFVKKGNSLMDCLLSYRREDGGFAHTPEGNADFMATEQAFCALAAVERMDMGKPSLYRMKTEEKSCTIEINCAEALPCQEQLTPGKAKLLPKNGEILEKTEVFFQDGDTVFDILRNICENAGIQLEYSWTPFYDSYYVEGINHLYEFDCGGQSGWMYQVNGVYPNYGCSSYELEAGDEIVWCYRKEGLGADVGANVE